jgi:hypothetical protein
MTKSAYKTVNSKAEKGQGKMTPTIADEAT